MQDAPDDEDLLAEAFAQLQRAAESAINDLTPDEVLGQYFPPRTSVAATSDTTGLSSRTLPTSMDIHNEAGAGVSDTATRGSMEDDTFLWGVGTVFGGLSEPPIARSKNKIRVKRPFAAPTFLELPPWLRVSLLMTGILSLTSVTCCARSLVQVTRSPVAGVFGLELHQNATFQSTYFRTLPQASSWKRHTMILNGGIWLHSLFRLIQSFRDMLDGFVANRTMQIRLLKATFLWLTCSALDGMLRLRTREEVSISMMTILMLMLVLSTFARNLAGPITSSQR